MSYRATFIYITHKQIGLFPCTTNTSEGIWLLTATEQLWSVASINDISANATQNKKKQNQNKKRNGRKHW